MKPHPRIRKTIKWGGAAVTVLLVVVWIGSGWIGPRIRFSANSVRWSISHGCIVRTEAGGPADPLGAVLYTPWRQDVLGTLVSGERIQYRIDWLPSRVMTVGVEFIGIPFWPLVVISAITAAVILYSDRRARRNALLNLCPKCNYDRSGIGAGAVCPECGERPTVG